MLERSRLLRLVALLCFIVTALIVFTMKSDSLPIRPIIARFVGEEVEADSIIVYARFGAEENELSLERRNASYSDGLQQLPSTRPSTILSSLTFVTGKSDNESTSVQHSSTLQPSDAKTAQSSQESAPTRIPTSLPKLTVDTKEDEPVSTPHSTSLSTTTETVSEETNWLIPVNTDLQSGDCPLSHHVDTFKELLTGWLSIAKKHDVSYYITCGTLLGTYWNGMPIPYDSDMDIIIDIADTHKLKAIQDVRNFKNSDFNTHLVLQVDFDKPMDDRRRFKCNGKLTPSYADHCSFQEPFGRLVRNDYHLDIYHYIVRNETVEDPSEGGRVFSKSDIFPLKRCRLMSLEMRCPNRPLRVLSSFYDNLKPNKVCVKGNWENT